MAENKRIRVAVIDDGINEGLYNIGTLDFNIEVGHDFSIYQRKDYNDYLPSHGTTCAAIIRKYAPDSCIGSIKILNDKSKRGMRHQLITAIKWCINNSIKLINLSLGTTDFRDFDDIRYCINEAYENGLIIIAACNNKNIYTVPACLTNIIGVRCRKVYIDSKYKFIPYPFDGIDVEASGRHPLIDAGGSRNYTTPANSYAAPLITALVYKILMEKPDVTLEEIKSVLYKNACNLRKNNYNPYICLNTDWWRKKSEFEITPKFFYENICCSRDEKRKIWDWKLYETRIKEIVNNRFNRQDNIDIPVIIIYDPENSCVLSRLNLLFSNNGYFSVKVSTHYLDIIDGCEYLPGGIDIERFISAVYKKYCCDIILFRVTERKILELIEKNVLIDIILYICKGEDYYTNTENRNLVAFILNRSEADECLGKVFKEMLGLLEGANNSCETEA